MEFSTDDVDYRTLAGAVVPRPVAWVSTRSTDGTPNLAPYSFFTVVAVDPPTLAFSPNKADGRKDTARNVIETDEFVVNVVTADLAAAMNETSATLHADEDEFAHAGVTPEDGVAVDAPRVAESPVRFECERHETVEVGTNDLVLGRVVHAGVDEDVLTDGKLDVTKVDALARLSGSQYAYTRDRFEMERPE
ncbi:nitrilotriacetate monooxygenase component B [Halarchaeum acidiphilum MH1-52-1]|uniref:Nitrilotriacetate monooxygenase component B n=1 Tax=Halarchaeum acidiphilum MH1-52-1 TaxID=1261545 RepID=U3A7T0_9EURY|nr:flavin reductase family protein [Halarchaeum acidiphilum]GAD53739.1 nitrilotriacetate monooxygenase component B [Halarchaeum acidiphilum MH1-52-1]